MPDMLNALCGDGKYQLGLVYIWQLCEKKKDQLLRAKNFGRKSLARVEERLEEISLSLDMNLTSIKHQLPQPPA